jgi:hypothetical protein
VSETCEIGKHGGFVIGFGWVSMRKCRRPSGVVTEFY